jgi:putative hemolysin
MSPVAIELAVLALLILLNGALAMAEMAIVTARRARLEQRANAGDAGARVALELANEPGRFLSTIQVGITLVGIFAGAFGGATLAGVIGEYLAPIPALAPYATAIGLAIVVVAITYLTLIFGELVPKRVALNGPERIASLVAIPMRALSAAASPVVRFLNDSTEFVLRAFGVRPSEEAPVTEDEVRLLLAQGTQAGVFEEAEQEIVEAAFRLGDRRVGSLMTPRTEVVWLDVRLSADEILRVVLGSQHVHFPVCRGSLDALIGVVSTKELLGASVRAEPLDLGALVRGALIVPETLRALRLLEQFRSGAAHFAVVIDEYGGVQGVVTLTDMFEALVGELPSAEAAAEASAVQREDGSWLLDGTLSVEDVREILHLRLGDRYEVGEFYSLGGLVMREVGRVPTVGDRFELEGVRFEVVDMDGHRVDKVLAAPLHEVTDKPDR